jgi:hypothetical protein
VSDQRGRRVVPVGQHHEQRAFASAGGQAAGARHGLGGRPLELVDHYQARSVEAARALEGRDRVRGRAADVHRPDALGVKLARQLGHQAGLADPPGARNQYDPSSAALRLTPVLAQAVELGVAARHGRARI